MAAFFSACGAGDNPASPGTLTTTFDTVAGVVQVMNRGAPPAWELRELLTLGSAGGAGMETADDEFGRLTGILADREGLIYLADAQSYDIRVFDREGRLPAEIPAPDRKGIPPFIRGDRLYLITTDEMDVEYVKVFAIEKG